MSLQARNPGPIAISWTRQLTPRAPWAIMDAHWNMQFIHTFKNDLFNLTQCTLCSSFDLTATFKFQSFSQKIFFGQFSINLRMSIFLGLFEKLTFLIEFSIFFSIFDKIESASYNQKLYYRIESLYFLYIDTQHTIVLSSSLQGNTILLQFLLYFLSLVQL